ncbi:MAG: SDR family NAD(P)-dependent oxidoreductase, partial [Acidimicrobiales bacterium]
MTDDAMADLNDRVILITGGTRGIGLGLARHLGGHGARVAITGRRPERLEQVADTLTELGIDHLAAAVDVRDQAATVELAQA